jgi:hypothetical protein
VALAALLSGCSAGGSRVGSGERVSGGSSGSLPAAPPVIVPAADIPAQAANAAAAAAMGDFIGDAEVTFGGDLAGGDMAARPVRRRGLAQKQVTCPGGGTTSVSGTVYIPSGQLPLYNAMVYVPDADLRPFTLVRAAAARLPATRSRRH